jgi:hypothetical protein
MTAETEPGDRANAMEWVASSAAMSIDYQQEYRALNNLGTEARILG